MSLDGQCQKEKESNHGGWRGVARREPGLDFMAWDSVSLRDFLDTPRDALWGNRVPGRGLTQGLE